VLEGVSVAFLLNELAEHSPPRGPADCTTRSVALAVKRRMRAAGEEGPYTRMLEGQKHFLTGGALSGSSRVHVVHAWDASFAGLVECISADAGGNLDQRYFVDVFSADLQEPAADAVASVQRLVAGADEVLLIMDIEGKALVRLWVIFEALLAHSAGKLRVRPVSGFGSNEAALREWEAKLDAADWMLGEATRGGDEKRLRSFATRAWDSSGRGIERMMAQLKIWMRREVYGEILIGAVEAGDKRSVEKALDMGARPEQRDRQGNTAEALASYLGRTDIEDLLFERRLRNRNHLPLSAFFGAAELAAAAGRVEPPVLKPFITQPGLEPPSPEKVALE